ncbi:MAG: rubrerythrin family protein [Lentisphaerae bacterium]|nr:MAG: rubrerythrin family protein [Lentisphaerota bacterium]
MSDQGRSPQQLRVFQDNEVTEHHIYHRLAKLVGHPANAGILERIGDEEGRHARDLAGITGTQGRVIRWKLWLYVFLARLLGLTFALKLMEHGENKAQRSYQECAELDPRIHAIFSDEERHERELLDLIDEERLRYMGSIVLGLNDALVELTGALAGFTFALQNSKLVAMTGLITGIAASLSMASSEYLSSRADSESQVEPVKSSVYTGIAYLLTVALLITPYLIFTSPTTIYFALGTSLFIAILIIAAFNFYLAVVKDDRFLPRFFEMAGLSFGVAGLSFGAGLLLRFWFNIEI